MERILKVSKWGNTQGIRIPKAFLEMLGLKVGDDIEIEASNDKMIITKKRPQKKEIDLDELFKGYNGSTHVEEFWKDIKDVGKEVIE